MDSISAIVALKALDGLEARSIVTAENIANGGTAGYRPLQVTFEQALKAAAGRGVAALEAVTPKIELNSAHPALRLDLEMATAASTAGRYGALIELLSRQMQLSAIAVSGGR
jgi:flagellar basal-body rod protein FlgB